MKINFVLRIKISGTSRLDDIFIGYGAITF